MKKQVQQLKASIENSGHSFEKVLADKDNELRELRKLKKKYEQNLV